MVFLIEFLLDSFKAFFLFDTLFACIFLNSLCFLDTVHDGSPCGFECFYLDRASRSKSCCHLSLLYAVLGILDEHLVGLFVKSSHSLSLKLLTLEHDSLSESLLEYRESDDES